MRKTPMLLSLTVLLAACSSAQVPSGKTTAFTIKAQGLPETTTFLTLDLQGPENRTIESSLNNGTATVTASNLIKGTYKVTARGWDEKGGVVLYKGVLPAQSIQNADPVTLKMFRLTSNIHVVANPTKDTVVLYTAKVGNLSARLLKSGSNAEGDLLGVPTGKNRMVIVEGRDISGALIQQGHVSVQLSEANKTVNVSLQDVSILAPENPTLVGDSSVKQGDPYSLQINLQDKNTNGTTLKNLTIDWGDGSSTTQAVNGSSQTLNVQHTYTAGGNNSIIVTATNTANLSSTASLSVQVLGTTDGNIEVGLGAETSQVTVEAQNVPASADRVVAVVTAQSNISTQQVSKQELQNEYALELIPSGTGSFSGALGLPQGMAYTLHFRAYSGSNLIEGGTYTFTPEQGPSSVQKDFLGLPACSSTPASLTTIPAVQGSGATSPVVGQTVAVRGVVTGDFQAANQLKGFYLQDIPGDGDTSTSDGIFVYTNTLTASNDVKVGDYVQLTGLVKEFKSSTLTLTELDSVTGLSICGTTSVPAATPVALPVAATTDLEKHEGMLITFSGPLTVTEVYGLGRYGELSLSAGGRLFNPTNGNEASTAQQNTLRRIQLDDGSTVQNPASIPYLNDQKTRRVGDRVTSLTGNLTYGFDLYRIQPTQPVVFEDANPRTAAPRAVGGTLKVSSFNVLNYFTEFNKRGANNQTEFDRQKAKIVAAIKAIDADILGLTEIQNNGDTALNDLVSGLNAAYGSNVYAAVPTGTVGTDEIKVAIIYKPAKVSLSGNFVIDTNAVYSRPPIAQMFQEVSSGEKFTFVINHFKSKGCSNATGLDQDQNDGQSCYNQTRVNQANALLQFIGTLKATDTDVLVMGDLNAYGLEDPIKALEAGGLESLNKRIPSEDRYSYVFNGETGYLDHALSSSTLSDNITGVTEWHINSDEPIVLDYNTEFKTAAQIADLYSPTPYRSSDHDPVVVGLDLSK
ncbi:ExeM/NucH family extracellular endonuclease [Deinococcus roseus]|uniref:PKD domain-containing protein n=1 Tax=Deinococcus roseus TaxID=392414 RepID=A0ABQ2D1I1_9DEIO|nr:ExeM/NucH family extracellular endonuclease [Deinococcus roseus]GGJ41700.1 hypothetical protein GCM10008938_29680 [Deinococcus roseus]